MDSSEHSGASLVINFQNFENRWTKNAKWKHTKIRDNSIHIRYAIRIGTRKVNLVHWLSYGFPSICYIYMQPVYTSAVFSESINSSPSIYIFPFSLPRFYPLSSYIHVFESFVCLANYKSSSIKRLFLVNVCVSINSFLSLPFSPFWSGCSSFKPFLAH